MKLDWQHRVIVLGWVLVGLLCGARLISNFLSNLGYIDLVEVALTTTSAKGMVVRYDPPGVTDETRLARAEEPFRQALATWPQSSPAYAGLGEVLIRRGQYTEAAENLEAAVRISGLRRYGYQAGSAYMLAGNRARALELWLGATDDPALRWRLAELIFGLSNWSNNYHPERWEDAIYILEETLKQPGLTPEMAAHLRRVLTGFYQGSGKPAEAERVIRASLAANPDDGYTRATLAWVLLNQARRDEALQEAQRALASRPVWMAHYVSGAVFLARCQLEAAASELEAGLSLAYDGDYRYYVQYAILGLVRWEQGDSRAALAQLQTYIELQPGDVSVPDIVKKIQTNELPRNCPPD